MLNMPLCLKVIIRYKPLFFLLLFSLFLQGQGRAEKQQPSLDFIYVNANTGEAAGGHSAIKFGSTVFHYQFFPDDLFLLVRDSWTNFTFIYNELSNRSIGLASLPLRGQIFSRLNAHFTGVLIKQQQDLLQLRIARSGLRLVQQLNSNVSAVELPTAGLFNNQSTNNSFMLEIKHELDQSLELGGVQKRQQLLRTKGKTLLADKEIGWSISRVTELEQILLEQHFFTLMLQGASLAKDAIITLPESIELSDEELKKLTEYKKDLLASIVRLCLSNRPDRAESLLLQTARYLVVSRSISTRILHTLDPFSSAAVSKFVDPGSDVQSVYNQLQQDGFQARSIFFEEISHQDIAYTHLETIFGRLHEVRGAVVHGYQLRAEPGMLLPSRSGRVAVDWLPETENSLLGIEELETQVATLIARVVGGLGYDLIQRNCSTELLRNINFTFADAEEGRVELGGWLTPEQGFVFIPAGMQKQVIQEFPVTRQDILVSRRLRMLDMLFARENDMLIWLRESNTLSSTLYNPRMQDSAFLFFTDNVFVMRPFLGLANLAWASLYGVSGLFTLPKDGGERIRQGVRGVFYSLPEVLFSNIRKGTYDFVSTRAIVQ
jgi:hypothetical protein